VIKKTKQEGKLSYWTLSSSLPRRILKKHIRKHSSKKRAIWSWNIKRFRDYRKSKVPMKNFSFRIRKHIQVVLIRKQVSVLSPSLSKLQSRLGGSEVARYDTEWQFFIWSWQPKSKWKCKTYMVAIGSLKLVIRKDVCFFVVYFTQFLHIRRAISVVL